MTPWLEAAGAASLAGRLLGTGDVPAVIELHRRVLADIPPGLLNAETDAFFYGHVREDGRLFGIETPDGALAAYAVLGLPRGQDAYNFGRFIAIAPAELHLVAHVDGVGVAAAWRGHGLHRALTRRRIAYARQQGRRHLVTTVAPANTYSLRNIQDLGFQIVATRPMFAAGHVRHLLYLDLAPAAAMQALDVPA